jgi:hypothetical protein
MNTPTDRVDIIAPSDVTRGKRFLFTLVFLQTAENYASIAFQVRVRFLRDERPSRT